MPRQRVIIGYDEQGNPIRTNLSAATIDELNDKIVQTYIRSGQIAKFGIQIHQPVIEKEKEKILFGEYAEKWLAEKALTVSENTTRSYQQAIKAHLIPAFGERYIEDIQWQDIQKFMDEREDRAKSSVSLYRIVLKCILDMAVEDGLIDKNPAQSKHLHNPATKKETRTALTREQQADIYENIRKLKPQDQCMIALLETIGTRRGEICGLKWEDIDFEENKVYIKRQADLNNKSKIKPPKNDSKGKVGLPKWVKEILLEHRQPEGYILQARKGRPLSQSTYLKRIKEIKETINLHGATAHVFRHTAITECFHSGADASNVQGFARHKNLSTTMGYIHPEKEKVFGFAEVFDEIVNKDPDVA